MAVSTTDVESGRWTVEDYRALDDDNRYEILEGQLVMVPAPTSNHQHAITRLGTVIDSHVAAEDLGVCFDAPFDVYLADDIVVQPDFTFVRQARRDDVIDEQGAVAAPDLVVEVLSPSTASRDRGQKRDIYARCGVPWLLLVDPEGLTVEVYELDDAGTYRWTDTAAETDTLTFALFPELEIDLAAVWDPDTLERRQTENELPDSIEDPPPSTD